MEKLYYKDIQETLYFDTCDNGLKVFMLKKEGFSKTYATFSAPIGGMNETIIKDGEEISLPHGIAHFLEHKLFEKEGEDVSIQFAKAQAKVNAFTQMNKTTYLFSATDNIEDNVLLLLDFVQNPSFTKEGVDKEKDIIAQEINMYKDNPHTLIYNTLMNQLYKKHPASNEILGSVESINTLDKDILELTHNTFYSSEQMILFVAGNIEIESLMTKIKATQKKQVEKTYEIPEFKKDDFSVSVKESTIEADIQTPQILLGMKLPIYDKKELVKFDLLLGMLNDVLFGKSSAFYQELLNKELINDSFGKEATLDPSHSYLLIGGETNKQDELIELLKERLLTAGDVEITDETFLKMKRRFVGSYVTAFNYLEFIANNFSKYYFLGHSLFDMLGLYKEISKKDILDLAKTIGKEEYISVVKMNPLKKA